MKRPLTTKDIAYIPHFYNIKWCRDLNSLLSKVFACPFRYSEPGWTKSRQHYHAFLSRIIPWLITSKKRGCFYGSLNFDFSRDLLDGTPATRAWGICHGTFFPTILPDGSERQLEAYERPKHWREFELAIYRMSKGVFVASELMANAIPHPTHVVGLPLFGAPGDPSTGRDVLWNHRLSKEKNYDALLAMPGPFRNRVVASVPKGRGETVTRMKMSLAEFHYKPKPEVYQAILARAGYVLSINLHDTFGYGVLEAIWQGKFAFAPDWPNLAYREFLPKEMLFTDPMEVPQMLAYWDAHPAERIRVVQRTQSRLSELESKTWVKRLLTAMEVEE